MRVERGGMKMKPIGFCTGCDAEVYDGISHKCLQEIIKTIERGHKMQEDTKQAIIALNEQTKTLFDMIKLNNEAIMRVFTLLKDLADILEGEKP